MCEPLTTEPGAEQAGKLLMAIQECLTEIVRIRKHMESDQADIEQSRARTRAILNDLKVAFRIDTP